MGVQNLEFHYFWGFSEKNDNFLGYEDFVEIFFWGGRGGHHTNIVVLGIISMYF